MSSGSDALSQEIRDAIRAKHRLVEKMKESVVEASDRPRDQKKKAGISFGAFAWWKVALVCAFVALVVVSVQQAATSDRAAEIRANMRARTQRKAWERAEVKRWSSERMLRHFGLRRASSLRFTEPVYTFADLWDAVRDPDTHVITVEVAVDAATMEPAVRTSTYAKPERFAMTLDKLLTSFARTGSNKGLRFVFRDPRAIEPTTRAIGARVDDGKIVSPVILEAEVAAGPEGYLPEMSAVLSDAHSWQAKDATEARPPRSYTLAQIANTRPDATFVPYGPDHVDRLREAGRPGRDLVAQRCDARLLRFRATRSTRLAGREATHQGPAAARDHAGETVRCEGARGRRSARHGPGYPAHDQEGHRARGRRGHQSRECVRGGILNRERAEKGGERRQGCRGGGDRRRRRELGGTFSR